LLFLSLIIAAARLHTYNEPRSHDITYFAVVGHGLLHGQHLYSELWDNKPPAPYLTYAATELVAGYGPLQVYLLGLAAAVLALIGVYAAVFAITSNRSAALWGSAFWAVISTSLQFDANEPNCEVFTNVCLIWAIALIAKACGREMSTARALGIGAVLALATLYKPFFIIHAALFATVHVICSEPGKYRRALLDVVKIASAGAAAWVLTIGYFAATQRWQIFYDSNVTYNHFYSPRPWLAMANATPYLIPPVSEQFLNYSPLLVLIALGVLVKSQSDRYVKWLLISFAAATYLAVATPAKFFGHYFQLWLPVLAITSGWALERIRLSPISRWCRPQVLAFTVSLLLVACEFPNYMMDPYESSQKYNGNSIVDMYKTSSFVESLLKPGEQLVQFGICPEFYFIGHRLSPTGVLFASHLDGPLGRMLSERLFEDLKRSRPEVIVMERRFEDFLYDRRLRSVFEEEYEPIPDHANYYGFTILMRRGGALAARLGACEPASDAKAAGANGREQPCRQAGRAIHPLQHPGSSSAARPSGSPAS